MNISFDAATVDRSNLDCIGAYVYGKPYQPHYIAEFLCVNKEGFPVLDCIGGECSRHATFDGPIARPGSRIIPLTWEEFCDWSDHYLSGDELITAMDTYEFFTQVMEG
jgi:hypothetical protein